MSPLIALSMISLETLESSELKAPSINRIFESFLYKARAKEIRDF
jgi:hypothetical protein